MKIYTLYTDKYGNPHITVGDGNTTVRLPRKEGVIISEEEAMEIMGEKMPKAELIENGETNT